MIFMVDCFTRNCFPDSMFDMPDLGDLWAASCWNHVCRTRRELRGKVL